MCYVVLQRLLHYIKKKKNVTLIIQIIVNQILNFILKIEVYVFLIFFKAKIEQAN